MTATERCKLLFPGASPGLPQAPGKLPRPRARCQAEPSIPRDVAAARRGCRALPSATPGAPGSPSPHSPCWAKTLKPPSAVRPAASRRRPAGLPALLPRGARGCCCCCWRPAGGSPRRPTCCPIAALPPRSHAAAAAAAPRTRPGAARPGAARRSRPRPPGPRRHLKPQSGGGAGRAAPAAASGPPGEPAPARRDRQRSRWDGWRGGGKGERRWGARGSGGACCAPPGVGSCPFGVFVQLSRPCHIAICRTAAGSFTPRSTQGRGPAVFALPGGGSAPSWCCPAPFWRCRAVPVAA